MKPHMHVQRLGVVGVVLALLAGCAGPPGSSSQPTGVAAPTPAPPATASPTPALATATPALPSPTPTAVPSATPAPTPDDGAIGVTGRGLDLRLAVHHHVVDRRRAVRRGRARRAGRVQPGGGRGANRRGTNQGAGPGRKACPGMALEPRAPCRCRSTESGLRAGRQPVRRRPRRGRLAHHVFEPPPSPGCERHGDARLPGRPPGRALLQPRGERGRGLRQLPGRGRADGRRDLRGEGRRAGRLDPRRLAGEPRRRRRDRRLRARRQGLPSRPGPRSPRSRRTARRSPAGPARSAAKANPRCRSTPRDGFA